MVNDSMRIGAPDAQIGGNDWIGIIKKQIKIKIS